MIKFLKREWFKLSMLTLVGVCTISIVTTDVNADNKKKDIYSEQRVGIENWYKSMRPARDLDSYESIDMRMEYLKLVQMEKLNKNLEDINKTLKSFNCSKIK